ncbi:reticulocyte-binding protein 3-like [Daktulosphaira vitifoliae]|uniref:reticulocyte-binding protein 3-like n=1 Tax=Daktulosphaira vitifoliae TaxID=58002 RepID=UPI0021A9B75C|nr:reticulocyte-binding protein 3-like [Daktulosphaira vitifoliae]
MMKDLVHDLDDDYTFSVCELLLKNNSKGNIVTKKNVHIKMSDTLRLINYEYTISLALIVNHVKCITDFCNANMLYPTDYTKCVDSLIPYIDESKELITRYISAIHFLRKLFNVNIKTNVLKELNIFINLVKKERNEDNNLYVNRIYYNFKETYKMYNNNLQKIVNNYNIDEYNYCVNKSIDDLDKYISDNKLPKTFEHYEFLEVNFNESLEQMKNAYAKHGFLYDIDKNETFYLYDV